MSSLQPVNDPTAIRVLHHMARSGGTLISKCVATMDNVILLSEIHPVGTNMFNPLQQAHEWYGLFNDADIQRLQQGNINFVDGILLIHDRCIENGKILVLRDWSHLDFIGVPFLKNPSYQLTLSDILKKSRPVINTATVRHPVYQWLSTSRLGLMKDLTLDAFLLGYRNFAKHCVNTGFIRYEDFTSKPENELSTLCNRLEIDYDDNWRHRWWSYEKITGDTGGEVNKREIKQPHYKNIELGLLKKFARNKDYNHSLKLLGYEHL